MSDKYFNDDFLEFVAKTDGNTFKQGSKQHEVKSMVTQVELNKVINMFEKRLEKLEKRMATLEKRNLTKGAEEDGWQTDGWGNFRLPPHNN